jgi:hypothetical protein
VIAVLAVLLLIPLAGGGLLALMLPVRVAQERALLMEAQARAAEAEARAQAAEIIARQKDLAEKARREAGKPPGPGKD